MFVFFVNIHFYKYLGTFVKLLLWFCESFVLGVIKGRASSYLSAFSIKIVPFMFLRPSNDAMMVSGRKVRVQSLCSFSGEQTNRSFISWTMMEVKSRASALVGSASVYHIIRDV